jgi:hypothetical protein
MCMLLIFDCRDGEHLGHLKHFYALCLVKSVNTERHVTSGTYIETYFVQVSQNNVITVQVNTATHNWDILLLRYYVTPVDLGLGL